MLTGQSRHVPPEELARSAESVAIGQVTGIASEWDETGKAIRSRVTLAVSEYVKGGGSGSSLTIYVPGGEVGGVGEIYSHAPSFRRDENVVVFVEKDKQDHYRVAGGVQGKYIIEQDKATGKPVVSGIIPLDQFKARIRNAAASGSPGQAGPGR
jgi:hypothetical protein